MRHAGVGAQRMAQAVAGAVLGAADAGGRQPSPELAVQSGVQVGAVAGVARQRAAQQRQCAHAGGVDQRLGVDRAQRLDRMVDGADAGRQPQPVRRVHGDAGVEDHRRGAYEGAGVSLLGAEPCVGAAAQVAELGARQRGGHGDLAAGRGAGLRHHPAAVGAHPHMPVVELLDAGQVLGQCHQCHLDGVDHGAAAYADDQVGAGRAHCLRQRDHGLARGVLYALVEQPDHPRRDARDRLGDGIGLAVQRAAGDDEDALRAAQLGLAVQGVGRRQAEVHPVLLEKIEDAGFHAASFLWGWMSALISAPAAGQAGPPAV